MHVSWLLLGVHSVIHLGMLAEIHFSLPFESLFVHQVSSLVRHFFLLGELIVHLGCDTDQIWSTERWVLGLDLWNYILDKQIVGAFCFLWSVLVLEFSLELLGAFQVFREFFIILSGFLKFFHFRVLIGILAPVIWGFIFVRVGFILIK